MPLPKDHDCDIHDYEKFPVANGAIYARCKRCDRRFMLDDEGNIIKQSR